MFKGIKEWAFRRCLRRKIKTHKRTKGFFNFNTAKTVGLIFVYEPSVLQAIKELRAFLKTKRIHCKALSFYLNKEVPIELVDNRYIRYFGKHEVNWYGKCLSAEANVFIKQDFDILIDFSTKTNPVMHYLTMLSRAKMKLGRLSYPDHPYDFVLSDGMAAPNIFMKEVKHYLLTIDMKS